MSQTENISKTEKDLLDSLILYSDRILLGNVQDEYPMVESIKLTKVTRNKQTGRLYPEFLVTLNEPTMYFTQTNIKQTVREGIKKLFNNIFVVLNDNIKVK